MKKPITLQELERDFNIRYKASRKPEILITKERNDYELLFNEEKLSFPTGFVPYGSFPGSIININDYFYKSSIVKKSAIGYISFSEVYIIRNAYYHFILNGNDKSDAAIWLKKLIPYSNLGPDELHSKGLYFINLAEVLNDYLDWLRIFPKRMSKYPDKYYAWYHKILIALGKAPSFPAGDKKGIIAYGKANYHTKSGFYQQFIEFNLEKKNTFVRSLSPRDRKKWKDTIINISVNDLDIIDYLKNFPD